MFEKFVVELHAANKVVCLSKNLRDGENPEYKMESPDMDDGEMKQFDSNWKAIVAQEAVGYFENFAEVINFTTDSKERMPKKK